MNNFNYFKSAREDYDNISIPDSLDTCVKEGICQGYAVRTARKKRRIRRWLGAAACFVFLFAALNLSPAIANAAANIPVLGKLFYVLTVVNHSSSENGINYSMEIPRVEANGDISAAVNEIIQSKVDLHLEKARRDWADYKDAFFATGGTNEQWADREMYVSVSYDIKSQTDTQLSFIVTMSEGWVTANEEKYCYNLDLVEDRNITLRDLLGDDWVNISNDAIQHQIDNSKDSDGFTYFFAPNKGGFTTVDETTSFYIRDDGVPVAIFPRYSIAAGAAGCPEFPLA